MSAHPSKLHVAALRVRDLQEKADYLEVHGRLVEYLQTLDRLAAARSELELLAARARVEALA